RARGHGLRPDRAAYGGGRGGAGPVLAVAAARRLGPVGGCDAVRGQPRGHPRIPPPGAREFCNGRAYAGLRADAAAGCRPGVIPAVGFASRSNGGFRMRLKLVSLSLFLFAATAWA